MTRWIDPDRPQELTPEQSRSVNGHPRIRKLLVQREKLKRRFKGKATKQREYRKLNCKIVSERLRQRNELLKQIQKKWDLEHPVNEVEMQLSGLKGEREDFHFDAAQVFDRFAREGSWERWLRDGTLILPDIFCHLQRVKLEIYSKFDIYAFHLGKQPSLPTMGWIRNMYHSGS
jgi:hypothetical protein